MRLGLPEVKGAENIDCSDIQRMPNKLFCQYHSSGALLLGLLQQLSNYGEAEMESDGVRTVVIIIRVEATPGGRDPGVQVLPELRSGHTWSWHRAEFDSFLEAIKRLSWL